MALYRSSSTYEPYAESDDSEEPRNKLDRMKTRFAIAGLRAMTSGMAQGAMWLFPNIFSQGLLLGQVYISGMSIFPSIFGYDGCNPDEHSFQPQVIWIHIQFIVTALLTMFQTVLWIWQLKVAGCYACFRCGGGLSHDRDVARVYAEFRALQEEPNLQQLHWEDRARLIQENLPEYWDEGFVAFKGMLKELGVIYSLQNTCSRVRSFVGAIGAAIEPLLSAYSLSSWPARDVDLAVLGATDRAAAQATLVDFQQCVALRNLSTSLGAFIAILGMKQAQMMRAYEELVDLDEALEQDMESAQAGGKRKIPDALVEQEVGRILQEGICGDPGKTTALSYVSSEGVRGIRDLAD